MPLRYYTLDVFTDRPFGGNPLAVFPDAGGLSDEMMQTVTREMNLSETVFVHPPRATGALRRLRIFTPGRELPFAGHPTIGTAILLAELGELRFRGDRARCIFEEEVGPVPVSVTSRDGRPGFAQLTVATLPYSDTAPPSTPVLAAALGLTPSDLTSTGDEPQSISAGVPFTFVPVRDRATLGRARLDKARWKTSIAGHWAPDLFLYCRDPELPDSHIRARMFGPSMDIAEDPATGAAVAALASHLARQEGTGAGTLKWTVEQGFEMGRPSLLYLEVDVKDNVVRQVRVGGSAVMMSEGVFHAISSS